ncbi:ABC transporter substrate-binding protein [Paraburkholderia sp. SIMBA_053]|uniref:ABC transporter substrate-binding protein n=1 Tax=Paraburkholderia sp. SIMBA_053 TaxID=3085794 RepID=UPI00397ACA25
MQSQVVKITARIAMTLVLAPIFVGHAARADTLKIGIIGPLSGGGAAWGQAAVEAGRVLADETNAAGGLQVGPKRYKVEIVSYDDKYNTSEAVSAYNRLVNQDGVKYVMILTGAATAALKQNVEDDKVLALTGSYTGNTLDKNSHYMFRFYSDPDQYVGPFVDWVKKNQPGRKVVTINPNDETGWHVADVSSRTLTSSGFQVVDKELFERSQKDFQPMLTKVIAMKPDIIDLGSTPPAVAGLIVRQARELGYDKLFTKSGGSGPRDIVAAAGAKAAEGTINVLYADPSNPGYQRLAAAYKKAKGQDGNEIMVPYYDGLNVLLHAIALSGQIDDTSKVAAAFSRALPMKSVQGDQIRLGGMQYYGTNTQLITVNYIGVIRNGAPVAIGKLQ